MHPQELKLDHFLVYDVANYPVDFWVGLQGQFDPRPERNQLTRLNAFANWVKKNDEEVYDKNAHLNWYDLNDPTPDPARLVYFQNQFGEQKIITGRARALLVPAEKIEKGSAPPERLDHYKVYQVLRGRSVEKAVTLEDQFGRCETEVADPYAFAVPVVKWHERERYPIHNEKAHLVFYRIRPKRVDEQRLVYDQFGRLPLRFYYTVLLGVPSLKQKWEEYD